MRRENDSSPYSTKERKEKFASAILNSRASKGYSDGFLVSYLQREGKLTLAESIKALKQRGGKVRL